VANLLGWTRATSPLLPIFSVNARRLFDSSFRLFPSRFPSLVLSISSLSCTLLFPLASFF
jgi:hypothetical protein